MKINGNHKIHNFLNQLIKTNSQQLITPITHNPNSINNPIPHPISPNWSKRATYLQSTQKEQTQSTESL